jgi:hypothetical protein
MKPEAGLIVLALTGVAGLVLIGTAVVLGAKPAAVDGVALAHPGPPQTATLPYRAARPGQVDAPGGVPTESTTQQPGTVRLAHGGTATLVRKELGPDAVLPVPDTVREATWWGAGLHAPRGATVMAGHVRRQGTIGPFAELWDARKGDLVSVVDTSGLTWNYRVDQLITVSKDDLPARARQLFGQDGAHRLVLVTCGGEWVGGDTGYSSHRIVTAIPVN